MRRLLLSFGVVLIAAATAGAQWRPGPDRDRYRYRSDVIERALSDLDAAQSCDYLSHHDRDRFAQARKDLIRFDDHWRRGDFDKGRLDSAIDNIHHLVDSNHLDPRERRMLDRDLWDLRSFRENRDRDRRYENGYRPGW